ncbi:C3a anaphylatoxin chemotactic receptor-like [Engystomops pustulosus]|uniref:C3a anaphylatoxin chemotactic receptor-like n=1 Tax=Engystomops pustulosus TaxID=76066 RepID=UPI003AFB3D14
MKKTISAVWFLNLAIADLLSCASLPLHIAEWTDINPFVIRVLLYIMFYVTVSASVLLLTAMSVDHWVSVMWPFWAQVHRTQKLVRITAGIIWGLSLVWTGLLFYLFYVYSTYNVQLLRLVMMFVIPFLIIVTSYVTIFLKLRKSNRPQRSQRPYRIITAVILGFFICLAPYYIVPLTPFSDGGIIQLEIGYAIVSILAHFQSCINPIIYIIMGQGVGHGFLRSIPFRLQSALSEAANDLGQEQGDHGEAHITGV